MISVNTLNVEKLRRQPILFAATLLAILVLITSISVYIAINLQRYTPVTVATPSTAEVLNQTAVYAKVFATATALRVQVKP